MLAIIIFAHALFGGLDVWVWPGRAVVVDEIVFQTVCAGVYFLDDFTVIIGFQLYSVRDVGCRSVSGDVGFKGEDQDFIFNRIFVGHFVDKAQIVAFCKVIHGCHVLAVFPSVHILNAAIRGYLNRLRWVMLIFNQHLKQLIVFKPVIYQLTGHIDQPFIEGDVPGDGAFIWIERPIFSQSGIADNGWRSGGGVLTSTVICYFIAVELTNIPAEPDFILNALIIDIFTIFR